MDYTENNMTLILRFVYYLSLGFSENFEFLEPFEIHSLSQYFLHELTERNLGIVSSI